MAIRAAWATTTMAWSTIIKTLLWKAVWLKPAVSFGRLARNSDGFKPRTHPRLARGSEDKLICPQRELILLIIYFFGINSFLHVTIWSKGHRNSTLMHCLTKFGINLSIHFSYFIKQCADIFKLDITADYVNQVVSNTNSYYGGKDMSDVVTPKFQPTKPMPNFRPPISFSQAVPSILGPHWANWLVPIRASFRSLWKVNFQ